MDAAPVCAFAVAAKDSSRTVHNASQRRSRILAM
jgi:hypothetical protein